MEKISLTLETKKNHFFTNIDRNALEIGNIILSLRCLPRQMSLISEYLHIPLAIISITYKVGTRMS